MSRRSTSGALEHDPGDTRARLLCAAFEEISLHGYQAASLSAILSRADLTKGALYHHFRNKEELGLTVVAESVRECIIGLWLQELELHADPIDALQDGLHVLCTAATARSVALGCPLNKLASEMSAVNERFRVEIQSIYRDWRALVRRALARGIRRGQVADTVDPAEEAVMFVATIQGCTVVAKNERDVLSYRTCLQRMQRDLEALRGPDPGPRAARRDYRAGEMTETLQGIDTDPK